MKANFDGVNIIFITHIIYIDMYLIMYIRTYIRTYVCAVLDCSVLFA